MCPGPFQHTFVSPSHGDSISNLASIGPVVSDEMFNEYGRQRTDRRKLEAYLSYKFINKPSAQVS